ncbi:potassium channel protein [Leptolyngbya sp. BC1307]|uniref:potassium channel protein n=1 Tax=Leptolyngbya sp. BC1307 TaxID=2029589 RepID=UPI000EFA5354|nr:potassium channel protein [Leptolyngbya sp. BC1307]
MPAHYPLGPETLMPMVTQFPATDHDRFIVCGLGSLGQQSIVSLKKFDDNPFQVNITAVDWQQILTWEINDLPNLLAAPLVVGDCRREDVLKKAGIETSRAILIVTSDESTNVECAIAARRLNADIQIILRSSRHSLNALLQRQLGKFVALDATELPAMTFVLAGLGDDTVSVFTAGRHRFRVVERFVQAGDPRFDRQAVQQLHRGRFRLLDLAPVENPQQPLGWATTASSMFYRWQPHVRVAPGDRVAYIEVDAVADPPQEDSPLTAFSHWLEDLRSGDWQRRLKSWRQSSEQSLERVVAIALLTAIVLWISGTLILKATIPGLVWVKAITLGAILLLGGYGDVFGGFDMPTAPGWVLLVCLMITLTSILVVLGVLGLVADRLLSSRFDFLQKRPRIPRQQHVVVVGLGRIGRKVTSLLQELNQPLVAVDSQARHPELYTQVPLLIGNILEELSAANLATAKSVIAVTDDQMLNLEVALLASEKTLGRDRTFAPVVRTRSQAFSDNLAALMPQAQVLCPYALSAEAFAGAAFGENILGLFRLSGQTILITEYVIGSGDTLAGKQLAQIAYGYGVVPILRETCDHKGKLCSILMPTDDQRLLTGDRLFVLSSINGLRRIERGEMTPPRRWRLSVEALPHVRPNAEPQQQVADLLTKLTDCSPERARSFVEQLPAAMDIQLYDYQAARLIQTLNEQLPVRLALIDDC